MLTLFVTNGKLGYQKQVILLKRAAVLDRNHSITLNNLPYQVGTYVDMTMTPREVVRPKVHDAKLWGMPVQLGTPFDPVQA